jgi:hypothetical protein
MRWICLLSVVTLAVAFQVSCVWAVRTPETNPNYAAELAAARVDVVSVAVKVMPHVPSIRGVGIINNSSGRHPMLLIECNNMSSVTIARIYKEVGCSMDKTGVCRMANGTPVLVRPIAGTVTPSGGMGSH